MSDAGSPVRVGRAPIGRRPATDPASTWVHQTELHEAPVKTSPFTARLTIDVTPALGGRVLHVGRKLQAPRGVGERLQARLLRHALAKTRA